jgi:hypothetical protein
MCKYINKKLYLQYIIFAIMHNTMNVELNAILQNHPEILSKINELQANNLLNEKLNEIIEELKLPIITVVIIFILALVIVNFIMNLLFQNDTHICYKILKSKNDAIHEKLLLITEDITGLHAKNYEIMTSLERIENKLNKISINNNEGPDESSDNEGPDESSDYEECVNNIDKVIYKHEFFKTLQTMIEEKSDDDRFCYSCSRSRIIAGAPNEIIFKSNSIEGLWSKVNSSNHLNKPLFNYKNLNYYKNNKNKKDIMKDIIDSVMFNFKKTTQIKKIVK